MMTTEKKPRSSKSAPGPARLFARLLAMLACLAVAACAPYSGGEAGYTLPTPGEHSSFKAMILTQPEFSEAEFLKFLDDAAEVKGLDGDAALGVLAEDKGWGRDRAQYLILKSGLATESLWSGKSYAALFPAIPPELYPSPAETGLARQYRSRLETLFLPDAIPQPEKLED